MIRSYFLHKSSVGALRSRRVPTTSTNWSAFESARAAAAGGLGSSSGSSSSSSGNAIQLSQARHMWGLVGGGLALFAVSRVALAGLNKLESWLDKKNNMDGNSATSGSSNSSRSIMIYDGFFIECGKRISPKIKCIHL